MLHLLAIAAEAGVQLDIDEMDAICARTPILADLRPGGRFVATDLFAAGGPCACSCSASSSSGCSTATRRTVDGRTLAEVAAAAVETPGQEVIRAADAPLRRHGGIAVLRGNLAAEGCVVKLAGNDRASHRGPARVFDCEEEAFAAVRDGTIRGRRRAGHPLRGPGRRVPACARCSG